MPTQNSGTAKAKAKPVTETADEAARPTTACPWMELEQPPVRTLKVYALDPSAGNYIGNVMSVKVKWEEDLKPGPIGRKIAVVDYDGANKRYYPPIDLNDPRILARAGLDPSESDPRFHQQMVYAVATETIERFEAALGRRIHWRRADRPRIDDKVAGAKGGEGSTWRKTDDIWTLNLFPHAMVQANAFYSPEAKGILFGYFTAERTNQGRNLPGQRVFTCLSHDIIAHEVTHAIIDGIRTYFTEPTNPDVLAFHEGFADLAALFSHFSHKDALLDTIQKTGGRLYQFELKPNAAPAGAAEKAVIVGELPTRNPLIDLAQQFGEASGMNRGLRSALDIPPNTNDIQTRVNDVHFRGSILVAAVFDAYFSIYLKRTADLFRVYRAGGGGGGSQPDDLPGARRLSGCLGDRFAGFRADDLGNVAGPRVRELRRLEQDLHPRVRRRTTPPYGSRLSRCQRSFDVFAAGNRYGADDGAVVRRCHVLGTPGSDGRPPVPSDEHRVQIHEGFLQMVRLG